MCHALVGRKVPFVTRSGQGRQQDFRIRRVNDAPQWGPASPGLNAWVEMESAQEEVWAGYYFRAELDHADGSLVGLSVFRSDPAVSR